MIAENLPILLGACPQHNPLLTLTGLKYLYKDYETKGYFQFVIIINVLVGFFCFT